MQIIFLCLAFAVLLSFLCAARFPMDSEGKALLLAMRSGGFSLAATIVLLAISRFIIDWSPALEESFQILYGLLLLLCIFWLFFVLFLTVKYSWVRRKK